MRAWLEAETVGRFLMFEQSVYDWAIRQMSADRANVEEAWLTVRALIARNAPSPALQPAGQPALAAAQATVTLKVVEKDGEVTVIDLGAAPEASDEG